jgi:hypothetical protein
MVMLKIIKKLIGVFNTVFVRWVQRIRVAFKSKRIEQVTTSDASYSKKQPVMELMNLRNELMQDPNPLTLQKFLETPQGQTMKAEAVIQASEAHASASNRKTKSNTTRSNSVENDVLPSNNGVQQQHTKKRKNTELDSAIQKQRDFLSGFVKKD